MKKLLYILLLLSIGGYSQTGEGTCSKDLNNDLKDKLQSSDYSNFKNFFSEYRGLNKTQQKNKKSNTDLNFSSTMNSIVKGLPVGNKSSGSYNRSKNSEAYNNLQTKYETKQEITDNDINHLYLDVFGDNLLDGYKRCLKTCEKILGDGVSYSITGDPNDIFVLNLKYKSGSGGTQLTLADKAQYNNMSPTWKNKFIEGKVIKEGGQLSQQFKRVDKTKMATFTINTVERISGDLTISLNSEKQFTKDSTPVGTIISSLLSYNEFMEMNNYEITTDRERVLWLPCNGMDAAGTHYRSKRSYLPDLRGLFLRSVNSYTQDQDLGAANVKEERKNPDNTAPGVFQPGALQQHRHSVGRGSSDKKANSQYKQGKNRYADFQEGHLDTKLTSPIQSKYNSIDVGANDHETRPKNITVFYYIKVNP